MARKPTTSDDFSDRKPTAFISTSLRKEDEYFVNIIEQLVIEHGFEPCGTVGRHTAAPIPSWEQILEEIPSADCLIVAATPRYLQRDIHKGDETRGISYDVHAEAIIAEVSSKPVIIFALEGTDVGPVLRRSTQYVTLIQDDKEYLESKHPLIKKYFENTLNIIKQKWKEAESEMITKNSISYDARVNKQVSLSIKLLSIHPSSAEATKIFSTVPHYQILEAIEYWISKSRKIYSEVISINRTSGYTTNDENNILDLIVDFVESPQIHLGIKICSFDEINGQISFLTFVHSLISRSSKYDLNKLIIILAANITNIEHKNRIDKIIGEIHQLSRGSQYIVVFRPEQIATIYEAYIAREHPLKYVFRDIEDTIQALNGIKQGSDDTNHTTKIKIEIEKKDIIDYKNKYPLELKLSYRISKEKISHISVLDDIEHLPITGEYIRMQKEQFLDLSLSIYDKEGKTNSKNENTQAVTFWSEPEKTVKLTAYTLSKKDEVVRSLDEKTFAIRRSENELCFDMVDEGQPLLMNLVFSLDKPMFKSNFIIKYTRGDAIQVSKCLEFTESAKSADKLAIFNHDTSEVSLFSKSINTELLNEDQIEQIIIKALALIQLKTGQIFRMPETITRSEMEEILSTAKILESGKVSVEDLKFYFDRRDAISLVELYIQQKIKEDTTLPLSFTRKILSKEINIMADLDLIGYKPAGDLIDLRKHLLEVMDEMVEIELRKI